MEKKTRLQCRIKPKSGMSFLLIVFLLGSLLNARFQAGEVSLTGPQYNDSAKVQLQLANPFLQDTSWLKSVSSSAFIQMWVWEHRKQISARFEIHHSYDSTLAVVKLPPLGRYSFSKDKLSLLPDFRESPFYQPPNVQEFLNLQMGRYKYLPTVGTTVLGMLFQYLQKYGYLLFHRSQLLYQDLKLSDLQIRMMFILWKYPGLSEFEWYQKYTRIYRREPLTFNGFVQNISALEQKRLVKKLYPEAQRSRYVAEADRMVLIWVLKDEFDKLDALLVPQRHKELRRMLSMLQNPPVW